MKYAIILFSLALLMISCSSDQRLESLGDLGQKRFVPAEALEIQEDIEIEPPRTSEPVPPPFHLDKGSKIIRSGNMQFEVDDITNSKNKVDKFVSQLGAYYEDEAYKQYNGYVNYNLRIRIQGHKFDTLLTLLEQGIGDLKVKNISANDVTEEYVDLKIRLANKLAVLTQYKVILKRAKTIEEILEVNEKIRRLEEEIDSKKGRIRYLDDRVNYGTLNLELSQKQEVVLASVPGFGSRLSEAFMSGISGFMSFIVGVVYVWPFVLALVILFLFRGRMRARLRRRLSR